MILPLAVLHVFVQYWTLRHHTQLAPRGAIRSEQIEDDAADLPLEDSQEGLDASSSSGQEGDEGLSSDQDSDESMNDSDPNMPEQSFDHFRLVALPTPDRVL